MVINLTTDVEDALIDSARRQGVSPEALANRILREGLASQAVVVPQDDGERALIEIARECGVSLRDSDLTREAIYES